MTKAEFAQKHGFCDEDMVRIKDACVIFGGQVVNIVEGKNRDKQMIDFIKGVIHGT